MNTAVVFLIVCLAAVQVIAGPHGPHGHHGPHGEKMKQSFDTCINETGADRELVKADAHGEDVEDEKVKCFHLCMGKNLGFLNEDGTPNKEKMEHVPPHIPEEGIQEFKDNREKCAAMTGENSCDTAAKMFKCMRQFMRPPPKHH